jgi:hypothetical protein
METEIYDRVMENMNWSRETWPSGCQCHYAAKTPDGLFIFDVWDSAEDWHRFADERLGPALAEATGGQVPQMEPSFYPLHREERA